MAGVNAALTAASGGQNFTLDRTQAYIGVMIEDLTRLAPTNHTACLPPARNIA
jgi:tRNA U34 5-carboxymethylaminomethyl modifying enzyme MnmG/GidA